MSNTQAEKSADKKVMNQFLAIPALLGGLLLLTGSIGIYVNWQSSYALFGLNHAALGPTLAFDEITSNLNLFSKNLLRINQVGASQESQYSIRQTSQGLLRKIGAQVKVQAEKSKGQAFERYLQSWVVDWDQFERKLNTDLVNIQKVKANILSLDKTFTDLSDKMDNIHEFIESDVKDRLQESTSFSHRASQALILTLMLGLMIGTVSSVVVFKSIKKLIQLVADGKFDNEVLINNLSQGFFVFDRSGLVMNGISKAGLELIGVDPTGKPFYSALPFELKDQESARGWLNLVFSGQLRFIDFQPLAPKSFEVDGRYIELDFRPICRNGKPNELEKVICITSDKTEEKRLRLKAENETALVKLVLMVLSDRATFVEFVLETRKTFVDLLSELRKELPDVDALFRGVHTLKGACAAFSMTRVSRQAHQMEDILAEVQAGTRKLSQHITSLTKDLDEMRGYFETFLSENENIFGRIGENEGRIKTISVNAVYDVCQLIFNSAGRDSSLFQSFVEKLVQEDLGLAFKRFESVVQSIADRQLKKVNIKIEYGKAKVYLDPYLTLISSFIHAFRNTMDHGIEDEATRIQIGKSGAGNIEVKFKQVSSGKRVDLLRIIIQDDGRGIDPKIVKNKALSKGLLNEVELSKMTDHDIIQLLFMTGFSTKEEISDFSGRGVGLDAVKYEASQIGGTAWVESTKGVGTTLIVEVPFYDLPILVLKESEQKQIA